MKTNAFVLDKKGKPLMPCPAARARELLRKGKAVVHRIHPFTIRLKEREGGAVQPVVLKFDPGSRTTGVALAREAAPGHLTALWLGEIQHRGWLIRKALKQRSDCRRRRRSANLRYRQPRFLNRRRPEGWLPPSIQHRVEGLLHWTARLRRLCPVKALGVENVRFDTQRMQNPEISGVEYQQGELQGYEVREYLLEKFGRKCVYCKAKDVPLEIEHVVPRAKGGSDRISNLTLACRPCNERKGARDLRDFLKGQPKKVKEIQGWLKAPLRDTAAVNATRWEILVRLKGTGLPVQSGSGGRTKWNRARLGVPKTHALDALCVGEIQSVQYQGLRTLVIQAVGRGDYKRTDRDQHGFPRRNAKGEVYYRKRQKRVGAFQTGVIVRVIAGGKHAGKHVGHLNVRSDGTAYLPIDKTNRISASLKKCKLLQGADGYRYGYAKGEPHA